MRIITANLNGIRSAANKGFFNWLQTTQADVICLQEVKAQAADMTAEMLAALPNGMPASRGYFGHFHYAEKKGYSGVGIYSKVKPDKVIEGMGDAEIDREGRYLECQFGNLSVISLYLPSGSSGEERQLFKFKVMAHFMLVLNKLKASGREFVVCGDWNIAHLEKDLKNFKGNKKNSGFLPEERAWLTDLFASNWVDVYRSLHPDATEASYTWWSNRGAAYEKNVGWRIDYQIATPKQAAKALTTAIYKEKRFSDHAPLIVEYS